MPTLGFFSRRCCLKSTMQIHTNMNGHLNDFTWNQFKKCFDNIQDMLLNQATLASQMPPSAIAKPHGEHRWITVVSEPKNLEAALALTHARSSWWCISHDIWHDLNIKETYTQKLKADRLHVTQKFPQIGGTSDNGDGSADPGPSACSEAFWWKQLDIYDGQNFMKKCSMMLMLCVEKSWL